MKHPSQWFVCVSYALFCGFAAQVLLVVLTALGCALLLPLSQHAQPILADVLCRVIGITAILSHILGPLCPYPLFSHACSVS